MLLTTFVVDSPLDTVDSGDGQTTLREAIALANSNAGHDVIAFGISPGTASTILLSGALPTVNDPLTIDGSTQPGITIDATGVTGTVLRLHGGAGGSTIRDFSITNAVDIAMMLVNVSDATIENVDLSLEGGTAIGRGLQISGSDNNIIRSVTATGRSTGIRLDHSSGNLLEHNNVSQTAGSGVFIAGVSDANMVRDNDASGSQTGIAYSGSGLGNQILNNDVSETVSWGISISRDTGFGLAGNNFYQSGNGLELRFMDGITVTPSSEFQLDVSTVTGAGLQLVGVTNSTIDGLDLSDNEGGADGTGLAVTFGSHGNIVRNVTATNRSIGALLAGGADNNVIEDSDFSHASQTAISLSGPSSNNLVLDNDASDSQNGINAFVSGLGNQFVGNDLSGAGAWAMTVRNDSQFVSTGNTLTGSANGVFLGFMDGLTLTPSATFDIDVSQVSGIGLSMIGVTNSVVADLDLSFDGSPVGTGLQLRSSTGTTVTDLTVSGRDIGVDNNGSVGTQIHCSSILNNTTGLRIIGAAADVTVHESHIAGNLTGIRNQIATVVDATGNFWGEADGPTNLGGTGDGYSGNVDAAEFLTELPACLVDVEEVSIDVKPGNSRNSVNVKSQGVIPVAIYTTADFDATTIVGSSVELAGVNADHFSLEDVDGDGDLDMILHFDTQSVIDALGINLNSGESVTIDAGLTGETIDEVMIQGFDTIEFFEPGRGNAKKHQA